MSTPAVTPQVDYNALASQNGAISSTPAPAPAPSASSSVEANGSPNFAAIAAQNGAINTSSEDTGEVTNDVGATVVVPKEGESFQDTVKRAVTRAKQHPDQVQADIAKETTPKNIATKTAQTLGAAATIGVVGPAALAGPGELISAAGEYGPEAAKAITEMAKAHPVAAKIIAKVLTGTIAGHSLGHTATGALLGLLSSSL